MLREFNANYNKIAFITPLISLWKDTLIKLKLNNNQLIELPSGKIKILKTYLIGFIEISELSNLRKLDISNNLIWELPYSIGNLSNLKSIIMESNKYLKCNYHN